MNEASLKNFLETVNGALPGSNLLSEIKRLFITDPVLSNIFGSTGSRIFCNEKPPNYTKLIPCLELWWDSETQESSDSMLSGNIQGRIILPVHLKGELVSQRLLMRSIIRFMESDPFYEIFETVPGLIKIGSGLRISYNKILKVNQFVSPFLTFNFPFEIDLSLFKQKNDEVSLEGFLDDDLVDDFLTTTIKVLDEETGEDLTEFTENINGEE